MTNPLPLLTRVCFSTEPTRTRIWGQRIMRAEIQRKTLGFQ